LDAVAAQFFGSESLSLIARGTSIIGRFGRTGSIRGTLAGYAGDAVWRDVERQGQMSLTFSDDYSSCVCEYGMRGGPALGRVTMTRVCRTRHPVPKRL
jgi:hypothetical protein